MSGGCVLWLFAMFCACLGSVVFLNKLFLAHHPVLLVHLGAGVVVGVAQQELLGAPSGFAWHLKGKGGLEAEAAF